MARVTSSTNSSVAPLAAGGVFAGQYENCDQFDSITVAIQSDVDSSVFGIEFIWSNDGVTDTIFDETYTFTHTFSPSGMVFTAPVQGSFFKIRYTNNPFVPQSVFSLQTIYSYTNAETRRRRLGDLTTTDEQAQIVRAVLNFFGDPVLPGITLPVKCSPSLNPLVDVESVINVVTTSTTIPDGADIAEGATTDAAVDTNVSGTVSGKLRGIVKILASVLDSVGPSWRSIWNVSNNAAVAGSVVSIATNPYYVDSVPPTSIPYLFERNNDALLHWQTPALLVGSANGVRAERTPFEFKTVATAAAGNTALWTPTAGKKFRLMRYMVTVTGDASFAAAAVLTVTLFDAAAGAIGQAHDIYVPVVAGIIPGVSYSSGWIDLGNGVLSAAANNVLNVNLSAALATGNVRVIACGTEE